MVMANRRPLGSAWKVQRRLMKYAVRVPSTNPSALATPSLKPNAKVNSAVEPKSTTALKPPTSTNFTSCDWMMRCARVVCSD